MILPILWLRRYKRHPGSAEFVVGSQPAHRSSGEKLEVIRTLGEILWFGLGPRANICQGSQWAL